MEHRYFPFVCMLCFMFNGVAFWFINNTSNGIAGSWHPVFAYTALYIQYSLAAMLLCLPFWSHCYVLLMCFESHLSSIIFLYFPLSGSFTRTVQPKPPTKQLCNATLIWLCAVVCINSSDLSSLYRSIVIFVQNGRNTVDSACHIVVYDSQRAHSRDFRVYG